MTEPDPDRKPKRPISHARMSGMVATGVLVFLFAFVGFFIWLGA